MRWKKEIGTTCELLGIGLMLTGFFSVDVVAQEKAEKNNIKLVGYNDLQGRSAYQPIIEKQGDRWIAYVGHEGGTAVNTITGQEEPSGTSILDVTDPRNPRYLAHIPGEVPSDKSGPGITPPGGAEMVRACSGSELPHGDKSKFYLLRNQGQSDWEIWDVTDPEKPSRLTVIVSGLHNTHKPWWECDTGIAYLPGGLLDWPIPPPGSHHDAGNHALIYDLSDPTKPIFIRAFGLPGQEPGSSVPVPLGGLHGVISTGPKGNRVYFANSQAEDGILEIVDRDKLLHGPREPTDDNLRYPVVARVDFPPDIGVHTPFPILQVPLPEFAKQKDGSVKDFLAVIGEGHGNLKECHESRQMVRLFDVTTDSKPVGVSTWTVPEASGNFCTRGGSFCTHSSNESFTPIYYKRVLFIAHLNAGVRALDIRDPYNPREIAYYIPATTEKTKKSCYGQGAAQHCAVVTETNNVEVDDRGYIYITDRAGTGLHILELTGSARQVADFSQGQGASGH